MDIRRSGRLSVITRTFAFAYRRQADLRLWQLWPAIEDILPCGW